jgi:type IV secretion system protein VirB5
MKAFTLDRKHDKVDKVRDARPPEAAAPTDDPTKPEGTNPYLAARLEWNERYGDFMSRARNWRVVGIFCAATSIVLAIGLVVSSTRAKVVPYVVAIDSIGRATSEGPAERARPVDERLVRAAVLEWVEDMRTVTNDPQVQMRDIDKVFAMISKGSAAQTFITDYYKQNSPFARATNGTVSVDVHSVVASSDKTFEVEWTETMRDTQGVVKETGNWQGSFTTDVNPPSDEQTIRLNPLGVYITHVSWSKVL